MENLKNSLIELQCELVAERTLVNPRNISWLQYDILVQLQKGDRILPSKLSLTLGTTRTKLSKSLKSLKLSGYIQQIPNQLDGRELYTSITVEGVKLLENISNEHNNLYQVALSSLNEAEQEEFAKLSRKFSLALKEERLNNYE